MNRNVILLVSALVLILSAGAAQAHGSLFGVFFKHHGHYACGHHYHDHGAHEVYHHLKHKHHTKKHYHGHYVHKEPRFIW